MALVTKNFSDIITFTRASTATFFDSAGVLTSAATNAPRFDYDPVTLAAQGLLIEESRANLLTYSAQFDNAAWTPSNATVTANATTAPDGATTGDKLVENTATSSHSTTSITASASATTTYAASFYAKAAGRDLVGVWLRGASANDRVQAQFNLNNGTISISAASVGLFTAPTATISSVGNGWYRCTLTGTTGAGETSARLVLFINTVGASFSTSYTGDGTSGLFLWGAQLEAGAFPTSYIPTTTTALTRAADVASVNTLSPWFNAVESTLYMEMTPVGVTATAGAPYVEIDNGALTERIRMIQTSTSTMQNVTTVANVTSGNSTTPATTYTANTTYKVAVGIKLDDMQSAVNGVAGTVDTTTLIPTGLTTLRFARTSSGSPNSSVWFKRFTYYPRRLSGTELANITA